MSPALPLPVAALLRRVHNAKSPKERHDNAYFAWECSTRLAAALRPPRDRSGWVMPSAGHFVHGISWPEDPLAEPELVEVRALFTEVVQGAPSRPKGVSAKGLVEHLPAYRNAIIGHGAVRESAFYERASATLAAGLARAWELDVFWPTGARLAFVDTVEVGPDGVRRARVLDASGVATTAERTLVAVPDSVVPGRLYARSGERFESLHPWVIFSESELREAALFFNGRKKLSAYLDYLSGEIHKSSELGARHAQLEAAVAEAVSAPAAASEEPAPAQGTDRLGEYTLLGKLGEGGMGVVYLARQEGLGRFVALKMLPTAAADDAVAVARFKREVAALARCDHPNVVKILASGRVGDTHYYAMELIEGADLSLVAEALGTSPDLESAVSTASERIREKRKDAFTHLPPAKRPTQVIREDGGKARIHEIARMFRDAAASVQALHEQGIIHRDIKPANLMVTSVDHRVVVMDLGLAALGDASRSLTRDKTSLLGTLRYMPPEQLQRNLIQLDPRADLYSLGATFYELLCGRPLFDGDSEARLIEQVLREDPVPAAKANPALPRDLALILGKCLEKDSRHRYPTADALARDLDAFLAGRPVSARAPTVGYLIQLALRRNKPLALALSALLLFAMGGLVLLQAREVAHKRTLKISYARSLLEQGRAALEDRHPRSALAYLSEAYAMAPDDVPTRFLVAQALRGADAEWAQVRSDKTIVQARLMPEGDALVTLDEAGTARAVSLEKRGESPELWTETGVAWLDVSSKGEIALAKHDGHLRIIDRRGNERTSWQAVPAALRSVQWSRDGRTLLTVADVAGAQTWLADGTAIARAALEGADVTGWTADGDARLGPVSADARQVVVTGGGEVSVLSPGDAAATLHVVTGAKDAFATDVDAELTRVVLVSGNRFALWRPREADRIEWLRSDMDVLASAELSDDGRFVLLSDGGDARVWDVGEARMIGSVRHGGERILSARWADQGTRLVSGDDRGRVTLWTVPALRPEFTTEVADDLTAFAFDRTGRTVAGISRTSVMVWRLPPPPASFDAFRDDERHAASTGDAQPLELRQAAFVADSGTVATWMPAGAPIARWGPGGKVLPALAETPVRYQSLSRSGEYAVETFEGGRVQVVRARDGGLVRELDTGSTAHFAAVSDDGARVLVVSGAATLWHVPSGAMIATLDRTAGARGSFARDGRLALATASGCLLWNEDGTSAVQVPIDVETGPIGAGVADDGKVLVCAHRDGVRLWSIANQRRIAQLETADESDSPAWFAISPRGSRIAVPMHGRTVGMFDGHDGHLVLLLRGHDDDVLAGAFDPGGDFFATASADGTVRVWVTLTGSPVATFDPGAGIPKSVRFSPDGESLLVAADRALLLPTPLEHRTPDEVAAIVRRGPWSLNEGNLVWTPPSSAARRSDEPVSDDLPKATSSKSAPHPDFGAHIAQPIRSTNDAQY